MAQVADRPTKRRRTAGGIEEEKNASDPPAQIKSARQLQQLLNFRQSVGPDVKAAINQFKDFLSNISRLFIEDRNSTVTVQQLDVLQQYCSTQTAPSRDQLDFPDLCATWSFAVQSNNESVCSAVPAALAQFYKTISGHLDFRDFGLSLGHTLLRREQVQLFDRGLSASRTKDHLISPCLRLLTEIASFDGGALGSRLFDRRDVLYKRFDSLLEQQQSVDTNNSGRRKPSVRRMALRLLIASLKFLDADAKVEFLLHGRILRNALQGLIADGDDIILDVLKVIEESVIGDAEISRSSRARIFSQESLTSLIALYDYEPEIEFPESETLVRNAVHAVLLKICTTRNGILLPQNGWFPEDYGTSTFASADENYVDLGLDSPFYSEDYSISIPVKNNALAAFAHNLNPGSDTLQSSLLLQIFRVAPELVAKYFSRDVKFPSASSEDPIWRGQFAFIFSIAQLPIPDKFGWQGRAPTMPPPASVIVENILPRQVDRSTLSRFFTSNDSMMILSGARLLIVSLTKFHDTLMLLREMDTSDVWQYASMQVVEAMLQRVPKLEEIVNALQTTSKDDDSLRSALFECLAVYHKILPEITTGSKFDIGPALLDVVSRIEASDLESEVHVVLEEQLAHLATIAQLSDATKWWSKSSTESLSLFVRLFKLAITLTDHERQQQLKDVLEKVARPVGFLSPDNPAFQAMYQSMVKSKKFEASDETWTLLDNAIHRTIQGPVKYLDRIEAIQHIVSDKKSLSLLAAAVTEQWSFILKKFAESKEVLKNTAQWIIRFFSALDSVGENFRVMQQFEDQMLQSSEAKSRKILEKAIEKGRKKPVGVEVSQEPDHSDQVDVPVSTSRTVATPSLEDVFGMPAVEGDNLKRLDRWDERTDIELAAKSGRIATLLRCTASPEEEVRRQAFQMLQTVVYITEQSSYEEKVQLDLLLREVIETITQQGLEIPLASMAVELAVHMLHVILDPAHDMYPKVNNFLLRGPVWEVRRLIPYWTKALLFNEPDSDAAGAWTVQVEWFLQWLVDGLRGDHDMEIYRRSGIFEKVLAVYSKPGLTRSLKRLVLTLIWRAICVGGADTLITRVGVLSWLCLVEASDREHQALARQLKTEITRACNKSAMEDWKQDCPILRN